VTENQRMLLTAVVAAALSDACSCPQSLLEERVEALVKPLRDELKLLRDEVASLRAPSTINNEMETRTSVMADGSVGTRHKRRLSGDGTSTFVSVRGHELHEFPASHSCSGVAGYMESLPVAAGGAVSWHPSPADATGEYRFVAVSEDWTTTTIDSSPAPLVIVHDQQCSGTPTVRFNLNVTTASIQVDGALFLGSLDVASLLQERFATDTVCIKVTTGTDTHMDGYIHVYVSDASGFDTASLMSSVHGTGSAVVDQCFDGFRSLRIHGSQVDGWSGTIEASTDGGTSWNPMHCITGTNGHSCSGTAVANGVSGPCTTVAVDLDATVGWNPPMACECTSGKYCTFVVSL